MQISCFLSQQGIKILTYWESVKIYLVCVILEQYGHASILPVLRKNASRRGWTAKLFKQYLTLEHWVNHVQTTKFHSEHNSMNIMEIVRNTWAFWGNQENLMTSSKICESFHKMQKSFYHPKRKAISRDFFITGSENMRRRGWGCKFASILHPLEQQIWISIRNRWALQVMQPSN